MKMQLTVLGGAIVLAMSSGQAFATFQCKEKSCVPAYEFQCPDGKCPSGDNFGKIWQTGDRNTASIDQTNGYAMDVGLKYRTNHPASFWGYGSDNNESKIFQFGDGNNASSKQLGTENRSGIVQSGDRNGSNVVQYGPYGRTAMVAKLT